MDVKCRVPNISLPLFWAERHYLRKRYSLNEIVKWLSQVLFSTFSGSRDINKWKGTIWSFLLRVFSNSLNMKRIQSYTSVGLVKILNDVGFITMMNMSFSFLGFISLTRLDLSEGWTYITSIFYPRQAYIKITRALARNDEGKLEVFHELYPLETAYHSWTLTLIYSLCQVLQHPHFVTCLPRFWAIHFKPLIWSMPRNHDLWSYDVKCYKNL